MKKKVEFSEPLVQPPQGHGAPEEEAPSQQHDEEHRKETISPRSGPEPTNPKPEVKPPACKSPENKQHVEELDPSEQCHMEIATSNLLSKTFI